MVMSQPVGKWGSELSGRTEKTMYYQLQQTSKRYHHISEFSKRYHLFQFLSLLVDLTKSYLLSDQNSFGLLLLNLPYFHCTVNVVRKSAFYTKILNFSRSVLDSSTPSTCPSSGRPDHELISGRSALVFIDYQLLFFFVAARATCVICLVWSLFDCATAYLGERSCTHMRNGDTKCFHTCTN